MKFYDVYTDYTGWLMLLVLVIIATSPTVGGTIFRLTWLVIAAWLGITGHPSDALVYSVIDAHW